MHGFLEALRVQRWDDHRYYHHSTINQALHLVSALSFVFAYAMIFKDPAVAVLVAWLIGMTSEDDRELLARAANFGTPASLQIKGGRLDLACPLASEP